VFGSRESKMLRSLPVLRDLLFTYKKNSGRVWFDAVSLVK
jgi:hypothetical protein